MPLESRVRSLLKPILGRFWVKEFGLKVRFEQRSLGLRALGFGFGLRIQYRAVSFELKQGSGVWIQDLGLGPGLRL